MIALEMKGHLSFHLARERSFLGGRLRYLVLSTHVVTEQGSTLIFFSQSMLLCKGGSKKNSLAEQIHCIYNSSITALFL